MLSIDPLVRASLPLLLARCAGGCGETPGPPSFARPEQPARHPPDHTVGGFTAAIPPRTLVPGEEAFPCWIFPIDLQGTSRLVGGASLTVGPGMHHGN